MATLDPKIQKLLNDFSKSQPALQLVGVPAAKAGVQLGDLLAQALLAAASSDAYTPTTPANWPVPPTTVGAALDDVAPKLTQTAEYDPTTSANWPAPPVTLKAALDLLAPKLTQGMEYDPTTPSNWSGSPASLTFKVALDRLAAACVAAGHTP